MASKSGEQKCTFKDCENRGSPQIGFDFYVCQSCFEELDRTLHEGQKDQRVCRCGIMRWQHNDFSEGHAFVHDPQDGEEIRHDN